MTTEVISATLRERIMNAARRKEKEVAAGEVAFKVRELSALQAAPFYEKLQKDGDGRMKAMAEMIVLSVIDENGSQVFSEDDISEILQWGSSMLTDIGMAIIELNGRTVKTKEEDTTKNLTAQPSGLLAD